MKAILHAVAQKAFPAEVSMVISDRSDAEGLQYAKAQGINTRLIERGSFADDSRFDAALTAALVELNPDLIVLAGFMVVLSPNLVSCFAGKIMNIHPSLLPKYKGLNTHRRVLAAAEKEHGCSTHFVVSELDAGPVIMQAKVKVKVDDNEQLLARRVLACEHLIYCQSVAWYCNDRLRMQNDGCLLDGKLLAEPLFLV